MALLTDEQMGELVWQHRGLAWHVARRVGRDTPYDAVDELAAELLAYFLEIARKYDPDREASFKTYLFRFVWHKANRHLAAQVNCGIVVRSRPSSCLPRATYPDEPGLSFESTLAAPESDESPVLSRRFWDIVSELAALTQAERTCVERHFRDGQPLADVANQSGESLSRTRMIVNRSLNKMRAVAPLIVSRVYEVPA